MAKVTMTDVVDGITVGSSAVTVTVVSGTQGPAGPQGPAGATGATGATGPAGADGARGPAGADGADGVGVPVGGTTGQVLAKATATDYDTAWVDATAGGGAVDSVNGQTGIVVLAASDVGADPAGSASSAQSTAEGYTDTAIASEVTRANGAYDAAGLASTAQANAESYADTGDALKLAKASNLSDVASASTARTNLGVAYGTAAGTVAQGNDARLSDARTPTAHAASHASAGSDPVTLAESQVTGLTTDLAAKVPTTRTVAGHALSADVTLVKGDVGLGNVDNTADSAKTFTESQVTGLTTDLAAKVPTTRTVTAGTGLTGGGDLSANRTLAVSYGTAAGTAAQGNDSRLSDARTPTAHASTHAAGGSDAVSLDDSQVAPVAPNDQTGTTYTFVLADGRRLVTASNASAQTYTVPPNGSVAYPLGTVLSIVQKGAGQVTLAPGSGVTLNSAHGLKASAQWAQVSLTKILTDTWAVSGDTTT